VFRDVRVLLTCGELCGFRLNLGLSERELPFATVIFNNHVCEAFSAAALPGHQDVAALMHGSSIFIDLATLQGHEPIAYRTTENSSEQGCH